MDFAALVLLYFDWISLLGVLPIASKGSGFFRDQVQFSNSLLLMGSFSFTKI